MRGGSAGLSAFVMEALRDFNPLGRWFAGSREPRGSGAGTVCALLAKVGVFRAFYDDKSSWSLVPRGALRSSALAPSTCDWRCSAGVDRGLVKWGFIAQL